MTSHAAVIARGMGKCCVAGASALVIHYARGCFTAGRATVSAGDWISLNGATGAVYLGEIPTTEGRIEGDAARILDWADRFRRLAVRANADTAGDARRAVASGAQGIGLCRVEFMLLGTQRMIALRSVLLQGEEAERRAALSELLASLRHDFEEIFVAVEGCPVGIRLLDFPLNELLPANPAEEDTLAAAMNLPSAEASTRIAALRETNPMVGHRGCRLGITHPDITEMQVRAAIEAACNVHRKGVRVSPEIVVPFVGSAREFTLQRDIAVRVIQEVLAAKGLSSRDIPWTIGSMIELPRAVLTADEIAAEASFFVLDTSHLTQTVCGFSHDDSAPFLVKYIAQGVYTADPFRVIDERGVGKAIAIACRLGRRSRPDLVLGAYGGHCDDPASIAYLHATGLDYVSCSPYMVPSIRLAAAHAALGRAE
jgi:pyruvate,orthophosphate dikinase